MTDTSTPARPYKQGRKPPYPPGHPRRLAIPWLHELDSDVLAAAPVYPLDVYGTTTAFPMWGNGPDPTNTTPVNPEGPGQPVGDCFFAALANDETIDGNPLGLSTNEVVGGAYSHYEADSQGVPLGSEQDEGVIMSDALTWCLTHDWSGNAVPLGTGIVEAFVPVQLDTVPEAVAKYGRPVLFGVNLTDADQQTFPNWDESAANPPDPNEGHVVLGGKFEAPTAPAVFGPGGPVSWEQIVNADAAWMNNCPEEAWLVVTTADRDKMGPAAFDQLVALMATLPGFEGETPPAAPPAPPVNPPPVNPPPVTPTPPAPVEPPHPGPPPADVNEIVAWIQKAWAWIEHHV